MLAEGRHMDNPVAYRLIGDPLNPQQQKVVGTLGMLTSYNATQLFTLSKVSQGHLLL